jgi:hypothetical protein
MVRQIIASLCFAAFCVAVGYAIAAPQQKQTLAGQVLDSSDNPIANVRVRLNRGSDPPIEDKSKPDGTYSISFLHGKPVDSVEYELTDWDRAVISGLSGARDHNVNKTLYPSSPRGADPAKIDPKHYKVEFENDQVRILRWTVAPREKTPILEHTANLWIPLTDLDVKGIAPDGKTEELRWDAGKTIWRAPTVRAFENLSDKPFESIVVEFKGKPVSARAVPK